MAELATPSAAAMFDGSDAVTKTQLQKPEKPDEDAYKASLKKAEKEFSDAKAKFEAARAKVDFAQPKNKDSGSAKKRTELIEQLREIQGKQKGFKNERQQTFDQIKKLDEQLKEHIAKQKAARSRVAFKSVEDLDREIARLEKEVDGGRMKLVDERKALAEASNLRKQRKGFTGLESDQKAIDETKAKIKVLRDGVDSPEVKALNAQHDKLQAELDVIKAEQDAAWGNIKELRAQKDKLHAEQEEKYRAKKKIQNDYFQGKQAFQKYEYEARQKTRERIKRERETYEKEKRVERAQKMLTEASDKAYLDEIRRAESLLRFLDPSYSSEKAPLQAPSKFQAQAQRTVDDSGLKGTRVVKKEEEDYFAGTGGKKGKKGRKAGTPKETITPTAKYSCPPSVMEDCAAMGIEPPMSASDIPAVQEKVKAKLDHWRADQDAQTEKNIAKAKKEVERLEAEEDAPSPAAASTPVNGDHSLKATATPAEGGTVAAEISLLKEAAADVVADLKGASLEDKEE
ncbi:nuclear segregation protein [Phlyctema vagabunda]|uniref:Nuclear segregation protein n=1 Tax=Phlyctema vagabunda TaxID=108571 RepID=A0ABR4PCX0_9HELO